MYSSTPFVADGIGALVVNGADAPPRALVAGLRRTNRKAGGERDRDAEVHAHLADRIGQVTEGKRRIGAGIDRDDGPAAAPDHFIHTEVVEVPAVREVHVRVAICRAREQFVQQRADAESRQRLRPARCAGLAGIPEPDASRALNTVNRKVCAPLAAAPMFEFTAAPDVVIASPSVTPPAYPTTADNRRSPRRSAARKT